MNDNVLVVKVNTPLSTSKIEDIYRGIRTQVKNGVVLLPCNCEVLVVPKDIEVRIKITKNKHKWMPDGYISDQYEQGRYRLVRIWKCSKCGKVKIGQFK